MQSFIARMHAMAGTLNGEETRRGFRRSLGNCRSVDIEGQGKRRASNLRDVSRESVGAAPFACALWRKMRFQAALLSLWGGALTTGRPRPMLADAMTDLAA
ncbi:hypothetical protein AA105894_2978 [Asaia spathodeae NBRC 105894]|nr:hypothetical protein AA105894_2978 [Asaia spathodeae NBRC 105894]